MLAELASTAARLAAKQVTALLGVTTAVEGEWRESETEKLKGRGVRWGEEKVESERGGRSETG